MWNRSSGRSIYWMCRKMYDSTAHHSPELVLLVSPWRVRCLVLPCALSLLQNSHMQEIYLPKKAPPACAPASRSYSSYYRHSYDSPDPVLGQYCISYSFKSEKETYTPVYSLTLHDERMASLLSSLEQTGFDVKESCFLLLVETSRWQLKPVNALVCQSWQWRPPPPTSLSAKDIGEWTQWYFTNVWSHRKTIRDRAPLRSLAWMETVARRSLNALRQSQRAQKYATAAPARFLVLLFSTYLAPADIGSHAQNFW